MSDVKITIRFRWKTCMHSVINAFFKIFHVNPPLRKKGTSVSMPTYFIIRDPEEKSNQITTWKFDKNRQDCLPFLKLPWKIKEILSSVFENVLK